MEQSPYREASRSLASEEIPHIVWNQRFITLYTTVHCLSLSWTSPVHTLPSHFLNISFNIYMPNTNVLQLLIFCLWVRCCRHTHLKLCTHTLFCTLIILLQIISVPVTGQSPHCIRTLLEYSSMVQFHVYHIHLFYSFIV